MFSFYTPAGPSYPQPTPLQTSFFENRSQHHHYSPHTPSPLRTARNANLMPPPPPATPSFTKSSSSPLSHDFSSPLPSSETSDENAPAPADHNLPSPAADSPSTCTPTIFSQPTLQAQESRFATRARSSSPSALLSAATTSARERRKSLFLERMRARRDDARFADSGVGDQVLRLDWVRERRDREERLARRAVDVSFDLDGDGPAELELERGADMDEEELSPTEEKEIEELLSYLPAEYAGGGSIAERGAGDLYAFGQETPPQQSARPDVPDRAGGSGSDITDEEDYDRLFMEMDVSGFDVGTRTDTASGQGEAGNAAAAAAAGGVTEQSGASMDTAMDMS